MKFSQPGLVLPQSKVLFVNVKNCSFELRLGENSFKTTHDFTDKGQFPYIPNPTPNPASYGNLVTHHKDQPVITLIDFSQKKWIIKEIGQFILFPSNPLRVRWEAIGRGQVGSWVACRWNFALTQLIVASGKWFIIPGYPSPGLP